MPRFLLPLICLVLLGSISAPGALAQEFVGADAQGAFSGIDLRYPEFSHPQEDVADAIRKRDFRFIELDRAAHDVPGLERHPRLKETYGTKIIRQRFHLFQNQSQKFSFTLRARAYAQEFNETLIRHLLQLPRKK